MKSMNRRQLIQSAGAAVAGSALVAVGSAAEGKKGVKKVIQKGRIKQSVVGWCFAPYWKPKELIPLAKQLGCESVELISPTFFPLLKEHGLECAIASIKIEGGPPFEKGFNNPKYHEEVIQATRNSIDACAEYGFKRVISFTGFAEGLSREEGAANCVEGYKKIVGYAEQKDVTICLEMLNTRDDTHPMKGHPGYQGDKTEYCVDIIKEVGSSHLKLLFDIYHVQIMDGDVIRRIHEHKDVIAHIHTAGNPGRAELDLTQEINYAACMQALLDIEYDGYVGQEFIPTRDPLEGLKEALAWCDV
jgi:hydroxypyruvate isomerase